MLKRLLTIGAILALPIAAACGGGNNSAPASAGNPDQAPAPASNSTPAEQPAGSPGTAQGGQPQGRPAAQPTGRPANFADAKSGAPAGGESRNPVSKLADDVPEFREITIPAGTVFPAELETTVSSETSTIEDTVRAKLRRAVTIDGYEAVPAGSTLTGVVTDVRRSGRVKGRAHVAVRFSALNAGDERLDVRTETIARTAPATKKADAAKIGVGAGAGAVIGGIVGGGSGAAKGAAIGGAGGTGVVLATRGQEVTIPGGSSLSIKLTEPVTLRAPVKR